MKRGFSTTMYSAGHIPLGIISCPGSEVFAAQMVNHLRKQTKARFFKKCEALSRAYKIPVEEIVRQHNYAIDLESNRIEPLGATDSFRNAKFEVPAKFTRFANGEIKTEILSSIRERDIYIVQDVYSQSSGNYFGAAAESYSVNDHFMTLLTAVDAALGAGPARVTCVLPAYPYARQHKKKGREGLTAALVGRILEDMGVHRILTLDIHSKDIEHTFRSLHLESMHASYQITKQLLTLIDIEKEDLVVVAPDTGAVDRNKYYANSLRKPLAMLYKERNYGEVSTSADNSNIKAMRMLGDVKGKTVFLADDMLGTGGTLISALNVMKEMGAVKVIIGISLPLFTGDALERFEEAYQAGLFHRIIGCNAVTHGDSLLKREWYINADVSKLFAQVLSRLHDSSSLGVLIDNNDLIQKLLHRAASEKK
jgi:ribose-phosphate pyrophosphokinase